MEAEGTNESVGPMYRDCVEGPRGRLWLKTYEFGTVDRISKVDNTGECRTHYDYTYLGVTR